MEQSTPYRNAWYRDLLQKEKELKKYTDDAVESAIELPTVTSEDDGDVLAVVDGKWAKSGSQIELPVVTSEDDGDVLAVVDGRWAKSGSQIELPVVTSSDNGDVLTVVNGSWDKAPTQTITVDDAISATSENPVQNKVIKDALTEIWDELEDLARRIPNIPSSSTSITATAGGELL